MKKFLALVVTAVTLCSLPPAPQSMVKAQVGGIIGSIRRVANPIPGQYIVVFKENTLTREVDQLARTLAALFGGQILSIYDSTLSIRYSDKVHGTFGTAFYLPCILNT